MRLGIVGRMDHSGLAYQSLALASILNPSKVLLIDSSSFKETNQYPELWQNYDVVKCDGIPGFLEYEAFLKDIDVMVTCETPYVYEAWNWAKMAGVRTFCMPNWELFDGLVQPNMPHPDQYIMPSYWYLKEMQELFPSTVYLPPPTITKNFQLARETNFSRTGKRRFVHIVGTNAIYDRNGWASLREALQYTKSNFELIVYSQQELTGIADPRVKYHVFDIEDQIQLYTNFDALILPRRYGGLCLPMNEALMAGLPVVMTDISPNNRILPNEWLLPAEVTARFDGRSIIDVYSVGPITLAKQIDRFCQMPDSKLRSEKNEAFKIGYNNYSDAILKPKYEKLLTHTNIEDHNTVVR